MDCRHFLSRLQTFSFPLLFSNITCLDVVTLPEFCAMLRIGDNHARRLLRKNLVAHLVIRHTYYIPKETIIDFVLSPNYLTVLNRFRRDSK